VVAFLAKSEAAQHRKRRAVLGGDPRDKASGGVGIDQIVDQSGNRSRA
jgi:hypothetical protein